MGSDSTYTPDTEKRLAYIEESLDTIWAMLKGIMNKEQFNRLNTLTQREQTLLAARVTELEEDLLEIQTEINNLL